MYESNTAFAKKGLFLSYDKRLVPIKSVRITNQSMYNVPTITLTVVNHILLFGSIRVLYERSKYRPMSLHIVYLLPLMHSFPVCV